MLRSPCADPSLNTGEFTNNIPMDITHLEELGVNVSIEGWLHYIILRCDKHVYTHMYIHVCKIGERTTYYFYIITVYTESTSGVYVIITVIYDM